MVASAQVLPFITGMSDCECEICLPMTPSLCLYASLSLSLPLHHAKVNPDYVRCLTGAK